MEQTNGLKLSKTDLRKLQLIELEMLLEVDRICRKHQIKYFLSAGTALGAVRHRGFIPWDDDLDTRMRREEYDKFCEACKTDLDTERFFFQNAETDPEYRWGYAKMRRKGTQYLRAGQEAIRCMSGVSIDIFVIDNWPDSDSLAWVQDWITRACVKTLWSVVGVTQDPSAWKRGIYRVIRHVPKKIPLTVINTIGRNNNRRPSRYIGCLSFCRSDGFLKKIERYRKVEAAWFEEQTEIEFEGFPFYICKDYMKYLENKYKNIWEYPPEKQRRLHPPKEYNFDVKIDLRGRDIDEYMKREYQYLTKEDYGL